MSEIVRQETLANPPAEPVAKSSSKPQAQNPAVTRCLKAWNRTYKESPKKKNDDYEAEKAANEAFRAAMPNLIGIDNIRDFIACIAYGMLNNIITDEQGTKLLYAAQVALASASKNFDSTAT